MTSQVQIADDPVRNLTGESAKQERHFRLTGASETGLLNGISQAARDMTGDATTPQVIAHGLEFVALPGMAEKLRTTIPGALRMTLGGAESFSGCIVLISEQEARLVTVITLWAGPDRARQCTQNSKRVEQLLFPYVDRWLRTRRLTAFLSRP